ncbi:MAG TPA: 6-phosphofructo-2-kinase/fructose-2,6-bisphosphatase [Polyangiaceae bacterium]|nr:6-phosphofructo-2-kinase/fructose-2,6-bisphosphatase [Polyangiaceae bacterium]
MPTFAPSSQKIALVMVGLPARGKSYIARKLARYLRWRGLETRVFNVGMYRREIVGSQKSHAFFDPDNVEGLADRLRVARLALDDMLRWLGEAGRVGIYDATNSTRDRRAMIRARCAEEGVRVVFVETLCSDPQVIDRNVRETKLHSPDYVGVAPDDAVKDFLARIAHYERVYQTVEDDEGPYVKLIDEGKKLSALAIEGDILSSVVYFLMNLRTKRRPVWMVRHGESIFNVEDRIGGDSDLSPRGHGFARALASFMQTRRSGEAPISVWTSRLKRTLSTAAYLPETPTSYRQLDEIDAGVCDGLTYTEVRKRFPDEFQARSLDKLNYRYPRGESYADVIARLDPMIIELERHDHPVLIISHQGVLRALYAYLMDTPPRDCPHLPMPLHTVLELSPNAYGCTERRFPLSA